MAFYSEGDLWDHGTIAINAGKDPTIYLVQFSSFHVNKLSDLSDLPNITYLDLKLK